MQQAIPDSGIRATMARESANGHMRIGPVDRNTFATTSLRRYASIEAYVLWRSYYRSLPLAY